MSFATLLARAALIGPAVARLKRNAMRAAIGIALVAALGAMGLAYLLIALRHQLEREIGPLWAPLAIGSVLLLGAAIAYFALLRPRRAARPAFEAKALGLPPEVAAGMRKLETKVARDPLPSIALALAAGFVAAWVLRGRRRGDAAPRTAASGDRAASAGDELPAWMREAIRRDAERRRANGTGA